jgi:hypothetical protein
LLNHQRVITHKDPKKVILMENQDEPIVDINPKAMM